MFRIIATIFLCRFFIASAPIVGMFSAFMLESGNSPVQMAIIFASFMLAMNFFEVPSSIMADRFSRKKVIILAIIIMMLSNIPFLFSQAYCVFIIHMVLAGIGMALLSGTVEAFAYDELKSINKEDRYQTALAVYQIALSLGCSAALFLSSFLVQYGWYMVIIISLICCFASLVIFTFGAIETKRIKKVEEAHSMKEILLEGGGTIIHSQILRYIIVITVFFGTINAIFGDMAMVTSIEIGWDKAEIARVFGLNTMWEGGMIVLFAKYCRKMNIHTVKIILIFTLICAIVGMCFMQKWSIFCVLPLWWANTLKRLIFQPKIQAHVKSSSRATVSSFINMIFGINYILLIILLGAIATFHSFALGFIIISLLGVTQLMLSSFLKKPPLLR
ncbi:MAG: MFS family permease [Candidatus Deianiraeaceae bacterium]|jgi:MFS family permease